MAVAECDLSLPEVFDEFFPFGLGRLSVFDGRSRLSTILDEAVLSVEDILLIDSGTTTGDFDIVVTENLCSQVDWEAGVDDVGDGDPAEVTRREVQQGSVGV